jgi:glycerophosphoryl diester phosphodiesterase
MWENLKSELHWIADRCRRRFRCALAFVLAFKALNFILLAPLSAAILRFCLSMWGRASVGNFELATFFLSPIGLTALLAVSTVLLASLYLELSGLIRLLADDRLHWWQAFKSSTRTFPLLVKLGLVQLAMILALAVPFLIGIGLAHWRFWSGRDIYSLVMVRPAEFWWGAGIAATLAGVFLALALGLLLRQLYAVPALIFEPVVRVREALRTSAERSRGTKLRAVAALALWFAAQSLLTAVVLGTLQLILLAILRSSGSSLTTAVIAMGTVLAIEGLAALVLSVLADISLAAVLLALYRRVAPAGALPEATEAAPPPSRLSWGLGLGLAAALAVVAVGSFLSIHTLELHETLEITAHRAGAMSAPENTLAALERAIADKADWVEIDVQLTADQQLIILHDIDLLRFGGGSRRVDQATLAEIQAIDVGSLFSPDFAGEQIPTLRQFLDAAKDRVRLNVELKPHSRADALVLTRRVLDELRETNMLPQCRLCSQSYEALQLARQLEPELEVGFILATGIGSPEQLDVHFLMVESSRATRQLVDRAAVRGIKIHAWTVKDLALVAPLLDNGVDNIITDDPAGIRAKLDEIRALSTPERLLLRARHAVTR